MATLASFGWWRSLNVSVPVSAGIVASLLYTGSVDSEFLILLLGMLFSTLGLALGIHFVIQNYLPPNLVRVIGGITTGGLSGVLLSLLRLEFGATLSNLVSAKRSEEAEWALLFLPF